MIKPDPNAYSASTPAKIMFFVALAAATIAVRMPSSSSTDVSSSRASTSTNAFTVDLGEQQKLNTNRTGYDSIMTLSIQSRLERPVTITDIVINNKRECWDTGVWLQIPFLGIVQFADPKKPVTRDMTLGDVVEYGIGCKPVKVVISTIQYGDIEYTFN